MVGIDPKFLADFYGKSLIAYGIGNVGKAVIPYLAKAPDIMIYGVTDSSLADDCNDIFLNTHLPMRSLKTWAKQMPKATILITVMSKSAQEEIASTCRAAGFQDIMVLPQDVGIYEWIVYTQANSAAVSSSVALSPNEIWPQVNNPLFHLMCFSNKLYDEHKASFAEFRGQHRGQSVAVVATGPSMKYYQQIEDAAHIGVNAAIKRKDIKLDYYFTQDYRFVEKVKQYAQVDDWRADLAACEAIKFFGQYSSPSTCNECQIPEYIIEENGGRRYFMASFNRAIYSDIEHFPLIGCSTIALPAIQFALYVGAKRILLVGHDCNLHGHFDGTSSVKHLELSESDVKQWTNNTLSIYLELKRYIARYHPDVEIISVNPIGLTGVFRDVYTENFLVDHPEIDRLSCEILR